MKLTVRPVQLINYIILIGVVVCLMMTTNATGLEFEDVIRRLTLMSVVVIAGNVYYIRDSKLPYWDFRLYFIVLNFIFIMGQVWLCYFDKEEYFFWKLIFRADIYYLLKGGLFALCSHQAIVCGMFSGNRYISENWKRHHIRNYSNNAIWNTGLITFLFFSPFKIYYDVLYMITASVSSGYLTSADIQVNGYVYALGVVSVIGLFYMISSKHLSKNGAKRLILVVTVYTLINMIGTGDRRFAIIVLVSIVLCFMASYDVRLRGRTLLICFGIAYLMLIVLNVIQKTRDLESAGNISNLFLLIRESITSFDIIWESFAEYGITLMAYVYTIQYFPAMFPYRLGSQVLYNIVTILPLGNFFQNWRIASEIQRAVNGYTSQPVGGAIATDLYGNFGWWSILCAFVLGNILRRLMDNRKAQFSQYECAVYFSFFCIFLNIIRAGFSEILRLAVLSFIIPKIFLLIFSSKESSTNEGMEYNE